MPDQITRSLTEREQDIADLRDKIGELAAAEGVKRDAADTFAKECKTAGLNPVLGTTPSDKEAFDRIDKAYKEADSIAETRVEMERRLESLVVTTGYEVDQHARGDRENPAVKRTLHMAERFLASEEYRALQRSGALDMTGARVNTQPVIIATREKLMGLLFPSMAALNVDALVPEDSRLFPPVSIPQRQLRVRDLVTIGTTDTDTVEYVEETTANHAAAETSYGVKAPESTYTYERREVGVKRIPHFVKATKGNLADAGQLRTLLDNRLVYGVGKRLDTQMVTGNGAGDNITGILEKVGLQTVNGHLVSGDGAKNVPDAFHMGITAVRLTLEDEPDAFGVHPDVYEQFVLAKAADGHYLNLRGTDMSTPPNIWGKSGVVSTVFPSTGALVGNWKMGATLWLRSGITVAVTDSDAEDFTKGIVTILAEMRAAFAVTDVRAFAEIINIGVS